MDSGIKNNMVPYELTLNAEKGKPPWDNLGEEPKKCG